MKKKPLTTTTTAANQTKPPKPPAKPTTPANHDHSGHEHGEGCSHAKKIAGPNGGRVITSVEPHAEFFVTPDNKVRITFLNEQNQPIPVAEQTVGIVCGDRSNPTTLTFTKAADNNFLLSNETLPAGNNHPTIVSFKTTPAAPTVRAKFILNLTDCPTCDHKEYACTCSHSH